MGLALDLLIGHIIGDFLLQPGRLVLAKRTRISALLLHDTIVGLTTALVVFDRIDEYWPAVLLVTATHLAVEPISIAAYKHTRTRGLFTFTLDQALHVLSIGAVVALTEGWALSPQAHAFGVDMPTSMLTALAGTLFVALFGSILVFEAANSLLTQGPAKGEVLRFDPARIGGMVERAASYLLALWQPALMWVPFVPRVLLAVRSGPRERARGTVVSAVGLGLCLATYVATVVVVLTVGGA